MSQQSSLGDEPFVTNRALIRLHSAVCARVNYQVGSTREPLVTRCASKRPRLAVLRVPNVNSALKLSIRAAWKYTRNTDLCKGRDTRPEIVGRQCRSPFQRPRMSADNVDCHFGDQQCLHPCHMARHCQLTMRGRVTGMQTLLTDNVDCRLSFRRPTMSASLSHGPALSDNIVKACDGYANTVPGHRARQ